MVGQARGGATIDRIVLALTILVALSLAAMATGFLEARAFAVLLGV